MTDKELLIGEIKREASNTRRMLERLEDQHLLWKPHPKSYATVELAQHVSNIPVWISIILKTDGMDLAHPLPKVEIVKTAAELLSFFDNTLAGCLETIQNAPGEELEKVWNLTKGEATLLKAPRKIVMRYFALNHIVHHRGQLSVYLRMQDIPVPGMYGPSADEKENI